VTSEKSSRPTISNFDVNVISGPESLDLAESSLVPLASSPVLATINLTQLKFLARVARIAPYIDTHPLGCQMRSFLEMLFYAACRGNALI
jgi:hypothetical protein